jgi:hypothetical protein
MADVYISYARPDVDFASGLNEALEKRNYDVWVDLENIPPTAEWRAEIYYGIESSDIFVFVISPDSITSKACRQDLAHAIEHNKRLVPIVCREVDPEDVPESLRSLNWIFLRDSDNREEGFQEVVDALNTDLDWLHEHTRLLTRAIEWDKSGRDNSFALRGSDLRRAEEWQVKAWDKEPKLTLLQQEYILASRKASTFGGRLRYLFQPGGGAAAGLGEQPALLHERKLPNEADLFAEERLEIATRALADEWSPNDLLGFSDYAQALADFIVDERTIKPLTIGIDAPWGMGKTTLMHMIESRLQEGRSSSERLPTVWFNAWRHDKEEALWAALALEILSQAKNEASLPRRVRLWWELNKRRLNTNLFILSFLKFLLSVVSLLAIGAAIVVAALWAGELTRDVAQQAWRYVVLVGGLGVILTLYNTVAKDVFKRISNPFRLSIAEYINKPNYEERAGFLSQFEADFKLVIASVTDNGKKPLVIFIDDLDRAAPPKPVEVFEAINMLLDSKGCVFVIGMDSQAVARSIEAKYKDLKENLDHAGMNEPTLGRHFLEKLIQIPFAIPRTDPTQYNTFINKNLELAGNERYSSSESVPGFSEAMSQLEAEQRQGKTLDQAANTVRARTDIPARAVMEAKVEIRAKSFSDSKEVRQAVSDALPYLGYNPRKVKRFINLFKLQALIANRRKLLDDGTIQLDQLAKWVIISTRWPSIIEGVISDGDLIPRLLQAHDVENELLESENDEMRAQQARTKLEPLLADSRVAQYYRATELISLFREISDSRAESAHYLHLTEAALPKS